MILMHNIPTSLNTMMYLHNIPIISHKCFDLLIQYLLLYYINVLIIIQNTPIYIHDIQIL